LKKILVTGAGGLLGSKLIPVLSESYDVTPTHNTRAIHSNSLKLDIDDKRAISEVFNVIHPDMVVHAAAMTNVDRCETNRDLAWSINAQGTENIADGCAEVGAKLFYVSTDYVFDGEKGLYREDDEVNPVNYYGLTKLKGEEFVSKICRDYAVVRTSVVYGWHSRVTFATWVIDSLRNRKRICVASDHINSPTLADDLAEMIGKIVENDGSGVYHACGSEAVSRHKFALRIAETFELDKSLIDPVKTSDIKAWVAKRPRNSSLCVDKLRKDLGIEPLNVYQALKKMKDLELSR